MATQPIDFLGIPLSSGIGVEEVCQLLGEKKPRLVTFINPQAWAMARKQPGYLSALKEMDAVLPDGQGVVWVCRLLTHKSCTRVSFDMTSLADSFFKTAVKKKISVFLAGGRPGVDEEVHTKLQAYYPELNIAGTMHGFGEFPAMTARIMEKKPGAVIVGMGAPRQEEFLLALREADYKGLAITCGGFFDQYLEANQYYPAWIDRFHLRFLWRLYKEPRRLWRRYLIDYQVFVWLTVKELVLKYTPPQVKKLVMEAAQNAARLAQRLLDKIKKA